ncbi:MAG: HAMP domain-containing histidine kinase [Novosphingobium sp.]|nr:HAMP domain-containing histidine kinase [Novosphingobium sp.]
MAGGIVLARGHSDGEDRLLAADEPLAGLQLRCGGSLPGRIAIPALLETVRKARRTRLKLARTVAAQDGEASVSAWIEVAPDPDEAGGCAITVHSWQATPLPPEDTDAVLRRRAEIDRALAELTARLDARQRVLAVEQDAPDLAQLAATMRAGIGEAWTAFVAVEGASHRQPMHWRLLDGAGVRVAGSERAWRVTLIPHGRPGEEPAGFELCLTAETPLPRAEVAPAPLAKSGRGLVGKDLAPVLRQPISRIIANAETIRSRLAGPLAEDYSRYAADIAAAGQHLQALIEDLADLEVVEADSFATAPDRIDLADVARRAAGILTMRAKEREIRIDAPQAGESLPAIAEFRRVLQILLNLIGNAIRYAPERSQVWIRLEEANDRIRAIVADQGPGIAPEQQARVFDKFERLGRSSDGGTGLGLYISRRLARAMGGELSVESAPGQGARFILELPAPSSDDA